MGTMNILPTAAVATQNRITKIASKSQRNVKPFYPPPSTDLEVPWTLQVYSARYERERWERYNQIANQSYAERDLKSVGEDRGIDIDQYPTYFAEATIDGGPPIGGVRVHTIDKHGEVPLHEELTGYIDMNAFRVFTDGLRVEGIAHGGGLWIDSKCRMAGLSADLARACFAMFLATRTTWYLGAGHEYVQDAWASLGWDAAPEFQTFPYPDDRYNSYVLCGSKETWPIEFAHWAEEQARGITLEGPGARFIVESMRL